ncbi:MAG: efflux RND transporter periplasmic adaptor subunit [Hyphomicrobiaceae bacterium]|nr:efflux RND transporter periplasmic adaptor subunit [Hyphomicrobiaceae bacterium]
MYGKSCPAFRPASPGSRAGLRTVAVAALVAAGLGLAGCKKEEQAAEAPQPVRVMPVKTEAMTRSATYVGTVRARYESDLGFRVGGKITERLVNIGDAVAAGQPLARLDATDLALTREANEAELAAARSSLAQAQAAERRGRDLMERGHVSAAVYDQRKAALDEAQGRLDRAERNLAISRNQAAYATLAADNAGIVTALPVEVGQVVAAGQLVVRLARDGEREAVVAIPEARLADIRSARSEVELWADARRRYAARLREISPQADTATRTYLARFAIDSPDSAVGLGMTATVIASFGTGAGAEVVRVPSTALINDGRGPAVWVVDAEAKRVQRRPVEFLSFGQHDVLVTRGLSNGERLVTLGVHVLDERRAIRVVEERPPVKLAADQAPAAN